VEPVKKRKKHHSGASGTGDQGEANRAEDHSGAGGKETGSTESS